MRMFSGFDIIIIFYGYGLIKVTVTVTVTVMSGISMECPWKFRKTRHTAKNIREPPLWRLPVSFYPMPWIVFS